MPDTPSQTQKSSDPARQNGSVRTRNQMPCLGCRSKRARCEVVDKPPCTRCYRIGCECVFPEVTRAKRFPHNPGFRRCAACRLAHLRCNMIDGRPPCTRCRETGRECVPRETAGPSQASPLKETVGATSTRDDQPRSTTGTAVPHPTKACVSCHSRKARCEIIDQPPCTGRRRGNRECIFEKDHPPQKKVTRVRNGARCVTCFRGHHRCEMVDGRPPCARCRGIGRECVPQAPSDTPRPAAVKPSLPSMTIGPKSAICTSCRKHKVRCEVIDNLACTECRTKHRKCVFEAPPVEPSGASFLMSELSELTPLHSSPRVSYQSDAGEADSSESDSSQSDSFDIKSEVSQSPVPLAQIPAPGNHDNIVSAANVVSEQPDTTQPTQISRTELAISQPTASETRVSNYDGSIPPIGNAVNRLSDTAQPTHSPHADSTATTSGSEAFISTGFCSHSSESGQTTVSALSQPREDILDLWDNCNFVRLGWLTSQEAVTYLDLFSQHLAPLSHITTQDLLSHENHEQLLKEDPMLCCTLLAISSRFFALPGPGGPSRSHYVHSQLWKHCEVLIQRILLGQESYSNADSRVLGAIESLMLISDWPPRSIHLPPDNPDWDGQVMFPERTHRDFKRRKLNVPSIRWQEDVFEPLKQVGQMSGRLLGVAVNLAYETGIFPDKPLVSFVPETRHLARFHRTRNLLCVYVNQMASRLGYSSPLPQNMSFGSMSVSQQNEPGGQLSDSWTALWMDLTKLINSATVTFSPSHSAMKEVLAGYNLLNLNWTPSLAHWHDRFSSQLSGMPLELGYLLFIEFHHLKACISALSIQAVVERAFSQGIAKSDSSDKHINRPSVLPEDRKFIDETISASSKVLDLATTMHLEGRLRYTPLRTRLCIVSASILLLKAISLGGRSHDLKVKMGTLDQCIAALRSCGIDDLDFLSRFAELVDQHLRRFRDQFTLLQDRPKPPGDGHANEPFGDDWVERPFDPKIAPCSSDRKATPLGIDSNSLDFLMNLLPLGEQ